MGRVSSHVCRRTSASEHSVSVLEIVQSDLRFSLSTPGEKDLHGDYNCRDQIGDVSRSTLGAGALLILEGDKFTMRAADT